MSDRISHIPGWFDRYAGDYTPRDINIVVCETPEGEVRRLFVTRGTSPTHIYLKITTTISDLLDLPNEALVKRHAIPPQNDLNWRNDLELIYRLYFYWDAEKARRVIENHYANTTVKPERHTVFRALGGYRRLVDAAQWRSWLDEHWPDTRDFWWDIGYVLSKEYSSLLDDLKHEYKI